VIELLTAVTSYLGAGGFGTVGTDLFSGAMPEHPAQPCTAVCQTGGPADAGDPLRTPQITVMHRRKSQRDAISFVSSLHAYLTQGNGFARLGDRLDGRFESAAEPGVAGYDARNLVVYQGQYTFVTTTRTV